MRGAKGSSSERGDMPGVPYVWGAGQGDGFGDALQLATGK